MNANVLAIVGRRVRFGAFLAVALLVAMQVGPGVAALGATEVSTSAAFASSRIVLGEADVTRFDILGKGGVLHDSPLHGRTLICNPCSGNFDVVTSDVTIISGGTTTGLQDNTKYYFGNFHGTIGITRHADHDYTLSFNGTADRFG